MRTLTEFSFGDGAHCGLSDWYPEKEKALAAALVARQPFDTGWYSSKKEIASARVFSTDGLIIQIEVSVSDDFDTEGFGSEQTEIWALDAVATAISAAWGRAENARKNAQCFTGFSIINKSGSWVETYLLGDGTVGTPPGDNYAWWGWQHDEEGGVGIPDPDIPAHIVKAFEDFANDFRRSESLTIDGWTIKQWD